MDYLEYGCISKSPFHTKVMRSKMLGTKPWYRIKADEYYALLDVTPTLRAKVAYAMFYTAGLILNEAYNSTWADIDLEKCLLYVKNREGTDRLPPFRIKDHEERRIPLPANAVALLTQWQNEALVCSRKTGPALVRV